MGTRDLYYRLGPDHVVEACSFEDWGAMFQDTDARRVARTVLPSAIVSTVFLGMDHGWGQGPPVLFETMVFARRPGTDTPDTMDDLACERYTTWAEAEAGHAALVATWQAREGVDTTPT